ncbi:two component transcriptional regulator, AraC family (plasmid) [Nostoc punctiforme PCC 73102]|uniref:Two component transcriptional regulator, AraC family n=3 Tax=Nostoc punctiforme TaxID=272131 RepID=B2JAK3_NOSP7|nr:two component transcriptional regulator, AraC family [Nostoc punctiforme PCC 73102]
MPNIIIIERDINYLKIFIKCMKESGFEVVCMNNTKLVSQVAQKQLPDLIICSLEIAKQNNCNFWNNLCQNFVTATIPLIFLINEASEIYQCPEFAADGYITKFCTTEELNKAIKAQLAKQAARKHGYAIQSQQVLNSPSIGNDQPNVQSILPSIPRLNLVFEFIAANYDKPISLCDVAEALGYSATYLTTVVTQTTGKSLQKWIIECRITAAQILLLQTDQSVNQIALKVGYENLAHFYRQFRDYHGTSPQVWREVEKSHNSHQLNKDKASLNSNNFGDFQ